MTIYYTDGSSTIGSRSAHCVTDAKGKIILLTETVPNEMGTPHWFTNNEIAKDLLLKKNAKLIWIGRESNLAGKVFEQ
jgi:hypothetical protein